ncbi:MAG: LolA family protein [Solirubrobacteraceae bacterium]
MRYLRTASTGRLLATIAGVIAAIVAGTAIAVAATSSNPVPKPEPLAQAIHSALTATPAQGISADINFTNNLISSTDFTGGPTDPLLQGATGRLWASGHELRIELQTSNGDGQLLVDGNSFWLSDPATQTVYKGTLPSHGGSGSSDSSSSTGGVPTVAKIQSEIDKLISRVTLSGATTSDPTDVNGIAAYSVSVSPKHSGGLLGSLQLAWDALRDVPLKFSIYARGNSTPVLQLALSNVSYGSVPASDFRIAPPSDYTVVKVATPSGASGSSASGSSHASVHGVAAVQSKLPFKLAAPASLVGLPRHGATLLDWGSHPAGLLTYGQGLGGIAVVEQSAAGAQSSGSSGGGPNGGMSLPSVSIKGSTGQELDTPLGTMIGFDRGGISYTVLGSVTPYAAEQAARALAP